LKNTINDKTNENKKLNDIINEKNIEIQKLKQKNENKFEKKRKHRQ